MYVLQNNVEIVEGAKNSCIYDLNTGKLYNLTGDYMHTMTATIQNIQISSFERF